MLYCSKLRKRYSHLTGTTQDNNWQMGNSLADNHRTSCKTVGYMKTWVLHRI